MFNKISNAECNIMGKENFRRKENHKIYCELIHCSTYHNVYGINNNSENKIHKIINDNNRLGKGSSCD